MTISPSQGNLPRIQTPLAGTQLPDLIHPWLLQSRNTTSPYHPVELFLELKNYVESLPPTTAIFKIAGHFEKSHFNTESVKREMMHMLGCWEATSVYTGTSGPVNYVNPKSSDASRYSDAIVKCDCGTLVLLNQSISPRNRDLPHDEFNEHSEECVSQWKLRSRAELLENRARIVREMMRAGNDGSDCYDRLGVRDFNTINHVTKNIGVDHYKLKEEFQEARLNTILELLTLFDREVIAEVYDVSPNYVRSLVATETEYSVMDFRSCRKENRQILGDENLLQKQKMKIAGDD